MYRTTFQVQENEGLEEMEGIRAFISLFVVCRLFAAFPRELEEIEGIRID